MNVEETSVKIETMAIRGAGRIARAASAALADYAKNYNGQSLEDFLDGLGSASTRLISTRPTAISLFNSVQMTIRGARNKADLDSARQAVIRNSEHFCERSNSAYDKMASYGSELILEPGKKTITICNSTAAISVIKAAYRAGKITGVYACETRPKDQGLITIRELADAGVPVTLIVDSAMRFVMPEVSMAFIGTDTLESDGSVINKIGSHILAATAHDFGVPVYACAETFKFLPPSKANSHIQIEVRQMQEIIAPEELPDGVEVFNPVFERVPPELITGIITEVGVIRPSEAAEMAGKYLEGI